MSDWHLLDGNMRAADAHYSHDDDPPCTFCGGDGCDACDEWDAAIMGMDEEEQE